MPNVPAYEPTVASAPLPGVRQESVASPTLLGSANDGQLALGKGAQDAGVGLTAVAAAMKERDDTNAVLKAEVSLKESYLTYESDVRKTRQGEYAKDVTKNTKDWWAESASKHLESLTNPAQKELFIRRTAPLRLNSISQMSAFEDKQTQDVMLRGLAASTKSSIDIAIASPSEEGFQVASRDIVANNTKTARILGYDSRWLEQENAEAKTVLVTGTVKALVDDNPELAASFFKEHGGDVRGTARDRVKDMLRIGGIKKGAQDFTDSAVAGGLTEAEALAKAREKFSGEAEDMTVQHLKARYQESSAQRERAQRDAADAGWQAFSRRGLVSDIPAAVLAGMDGRDKVAIREAARRLAKQGEEKMPKTDWGVYYELRQQALNNPAAFRTRDLRRDFDRLAPAQREQLVDLQGKKPEARQESVALAAQLSNMHDQMNWGASDREAKGKFDSAVSQAVTNEEKRTGKKLDYDERQKIIDKMLVEGEVLSGKWYLNDPNKRVYELTPDEIAKFAPKIPKVERAKIEAAIIGDKKAVTDEEVVRRYKRKMGL